MGPIAAMRIGISILFNSKARASNPPIVSALITTPSSERSTEILASLRASFSAFDNNSDEFVCRKMVPARTFSNPGPTIFKPHAAIACSHESHLSPASRISDMPLARNMPLM
ncbi:MAG: Uncharacterised protein [Methanobacteriota archaeon]|nr:MAG: Uncharacterised protein [Euryarchaeota archaeon]